MTMPDLHSSHSSYGWRWLASIALVASIQLGPSAEPVPVVPSLVTAPAPAPAGSQIDIDALVTDALTGNAGAIMTLKAAVLGYDEAQAMAVLERVRKSGVSRNSTIAAGLLRHREPWVQRTAITTIAKLGLDGRETLDLLVKAVEDPLPLVAQAAAAALGDLRDARSWPPLIALLASADPSLVRLAHESLQRQTNQTWPAEQRLWEEWFDQRRADEQSQFASYQLMLAEGSLGDPVTAVDGLASLDLLRDQATAILVTLVDHPDATVRAHVERHLRQWTGTLGGEAIGVAMERAQTRAVAPPPPPTVATIAPTVAVVATPNDHSGPGFFESTYGMVLIVTICCAGLAVLLWFLRTPAGQLVQGATNRFTKRMGRSRVVVMISNGTKRFAKHLPGPLKGMTKRIAAPAKALAGQLKEETRRMLKPTDESK